MPKQKNRQVAKKRFKITKTGKVLMKHGNSSHLSRKDDSSSSSRKKRFKRVSKAFSIKIKKMVSR